MPFYDDARYGVVQTLRMGTDLTRSAANSSVAAAVVELDRMTMMTAVTIKDWNIKVVNGATCTGANLLFDFSLSKSLAGTGALAQFGSAAVGTAADGSVIDCAVTTETDLAAGDDLVLTREIGTPLPAGTMGIEADVAFVEKFTVT